MNNKTDAYNFQRKSFKYKAQIYMVGITDHTLKKQRAALTGYLQIPHELQISLDVEDSFDPPNLFLLHTILLLIYKYRTFPITQIVLQKRQYALFSEFNM